jgi:hypothetical protein
MGANSFNPHWEPQSEGLIFKRHVRNWFLFDVSTVGMQHHGMVVKAVFKDVKTNTSWPAADVYLNNDYERSTFSRLGWAFDAWTFPSYSAIVADVKVLNLDGDVLHSVAPLANFTPGSRGY